MNVAKKKFFDSDFPSPCFDVPKASNFTSGGVQNRDTKNRRLGKIVTSIQDSKPREKQISQSFSYCEVINLLRNGTIVRCLWENKETYMTPLPTSLIFQACVSLFLLNFSMLVFSRFDRCDSFDTRFELIRLYPIPSPRIFFEIIGCRARFGRRRKHNVALAGLICFQQHKHVAKTSKLWRSDVIQQSADRFVNIQSSPKIADFSNFKLIST